MKNKILACLLLHIIFWLLLTLCVFYKSQGVIFFDCLVLPVVWLFPVVTLCVSVIMILFIDDIKAEFASDNC